MQGVIGFLIQIRRLHLRHLLLHLTLVGELLLLEHLALLAHAQPRLQSAHQVTDTLSHVQDRDMCISRMNKTEEGSTATEV